MLEQVQRPQVAAADTQGTAGRFVEQVHRTRELPGRQQERIVGGHVLTGHDSMLSLSDSRTNGEVMRWTESIIGDRPPQQVAAFIADENELMPWSAWPEATGYTCSVDGDGTSVGSCIVFRDKKGIEQGRQRLISVASDRIEYRLTNRGPSAARLHWRMARIACASTAHQPARTCGRSGQIASSFSQHLRLARRRLTDSARQPGSRSRPEDWGHRRSSPARQALEYLARGSTRRVRIHWHPEDFRCE